MIFDSHRMAELRQEYASDPDNLVPFIVTLDRDDRFVNERIALEEAFALMPDSEKKILLGKLINRSRGAHLGAWFQLMLLDWLKYANVGLIETEPFLHGTHPDFLVVDAADEKVVVEARALVDRSWDDPYQQTTEEVARLLRGVERPYVLGLDIVSYGNEFDAEDFVAFILNFLDEGEGQMEDYEDGKGTEIVIDAFYHPSARHLLFAMTLPTVIVCGEPLKRPLEEKAWQHKALADHSIPYVIAIYLESSALSPEEVLEAWLGRETATVDKHTGEVLGLTVERTGLHFGRREMRFSNVSGTLVFQSYFDSDLRRRFLTANYIENPFALFPIDPHTFPSQKRYMVVGRDDESFQMRWVSDSDDSSTLAETDTT